MKKLFLLPVLILTMYAQNGNTQNAIKRSYTRTETVIQSEKNKHLIGSDKMKKIGKRSFTHAFLVSPQSGLKYVIRLANLLNDRPSTYNKENTLIISQNGENQWIEEAAEGYSVLKLPVSLIKDLGKRIIEYDLVCLSAEDQASSDGKYQIELIEKRDILKK